MVDSTIYDSRFTIYQSPMNEWEWQLLEEKTPLDHVVDLVALN